MHNFVAFYIELTVAPPLCILCTSRFKFKCKKIICAFLKGKIETKLLEASQFQFSVKFNKTSSRRH